MFLGVHDYIYLYRVDKLVNFFYKN